MIRWIALRLPAVTMPPAPAPAPAPSGLGPRTGDPRHRRLPGTSAGPRRPVPRPRIASRPARPGTDRPRRPRSGPARPERRAVPHRPQARPVLRRALGSGARRLHRRPWPDGACRLRAQDRSAPGRLPRLPQGRAAALPDEGGGGIARRGPGGILFLKWKRPAPPGPRSPRGTGPTTRRSSNGWPALTTDTGTVFTVHPRPRTTSGRRRVRLHGRGLQRTCTGTVVQRLRGHGVDNLAPVLVHMAYVPHTTKSWFDRMYPATTWSTGSASTRTPTSTPVTVTATSPAAEPAELGPARPGRLLQLGDAQAPAAVDGRRVGVWSSKKNPPQAEFYREVGRRSGTSRTSAPRCTSTPRTTRTATVVDATPAAREEYRHAREDAGLPVDVAPSLP